LHPAHLPSDFPVIFCLFSFDFLFPFFSFLRFFVFSCFNSPADSVLDSLYERIID